MFSTCLHACRYIELTNDCNIDLNKPHSNQCKIHNFKGDTYSSCNIATESFGHIVIMNCPIKKRFEVLTVLKMSVVVFRVVTPYSLNHLKP
jgi:hypothetical protein